MCFDGSVHHSVSIYTVRIHYRLQRSHAEPVCFLKSNVGACILGIAIVLTDFSIIQFGHLTSLVLLVTLLSCSWNSFKILFLRILAIDIDLSCML